ncbi:MAG: hypothetical protein ABFS28_15380 [Bacteroidota bacterium]
MLVLLTGCRNHRLKADLSGIDALVKMERFDRALFEMEADTIDDAIGELYSRYGDFFDVFNVHVIQIGQASSRHYASYLSMFINDPINREVYDYTNKVFPSLDELDGELTQGFKHYLYHYPDSIPPRVIAYVSRFNQGLLTVGNFVGVGLDQYLGSDCKYYEQMGTPRYLVKNKTGERIPVDVMYAYATRLYPYNDSLDNVLSRMIHQGQMLYFVDAMLPAREEELKMGFTSDQMKWCQNNEKQMWTHLVEEKLLFSTDPLNIRKLVEDAPHTPFYTSESPGRAAVWQGWQIVRAFADRNPGLSLHQIMSERDYQEILRISRYNP